VVEAKVGQRCLRPFALEFGMCHGELVEFCAIWGGGWAYDGHGDEVCGTTGGVWEHNATKGLLFGGEGGRNPKI
jgi:hypothetical protein